MYLLDFYIPIRMFKNVKARVPVEGHYALRLATVSFVKRQSSLPFARLVPSFSAIQVSLSQASYIISLSVCLSLSLSLSLCLSVPSSLSLFLSRSVNLPRTLRLSSRCRSRSPPPVSTTCVSVGSGPFFLVCLRSVSSVSHYATVRPRRRVLQRYRVSAGLFRFPQCTLD